MRKLSRVCQGPQRPIKLLHLALLAAVVLLGWRIWATRQPKWSRKGLRVAYATLLLPKNTTDSSENDRDEYFSSTRLLNYQLRQDRHTRTSHSIPFLVLVSPDIQSWKCDQLVQEGAKIIPVERLHVDWIKPGKERWKDVMIKLRLFELIEYDRILFLDADTFLFRPLDSIFDDPAAQPQRTLQKADIKSDEAPLPNEYVFATTSEVMHTTHSYPPVPMSYFNAGFFVMSPSLDLFKYYTSLFNVPGKFDTTYPEQNLLNYAHRQDGNMPWGRLHYGWNIQLPHPNDVRRGVASVHAKLWTAGNELQPIKPELQARWKTKKREMENFYQ